MICNFRVFMAKIAEWSGEPDDVSNFENFDYISKYYKIDRIFLCYEKTLYYVL